MKKSNNAFLQKVKDNAFYIAFGVGIFALLAVITVYTVQQQNTQVAELDLNTASDYQEITKGIPDVEETNGKTTNSSGTRNRDTIAEVTTAEKTEAENENAEESKNTAASLPEERDEETALPVISPAGELTFNSEETLAWPVNGEVVLPYSMKTTVYFKTLDQYKCNPGMMIAAGSGTTVKSAYLGKVTKVTSDNVYGNLVTVYLGNDYSVVYGQLDTIYVKEGDYVKKGDSIGTIGAPTDSFSEEGNHLFFEMLEGETPIDPMLFIE